jgi:hypothetical protein
MDEDKLGEEYRTWEKDGTEFGEHNTVYLATLQEIRMGYARFGVRINQIKSIKVMAFWASSEYVCLYH